MYHRRRAACPQGPTYCTFWVRAPASAVLYVPRTVAPGAQVGWLSPQVSAGVLPLLERLKYSPDTEARDAAGQALGNLARVLTPNSRRIIEQDTVQLDRAGRAGGRRRQSPLARAANATSVVWTSPLAGES